MSVTRRDFLRRAAFGVLPLAGLRAHRQDPPRAQRPDSARNAADTLANPVSGSTAALGPLDNDRGVIAIERRLRCSCGCTLDVYTCRTTDFSCTYSPAMHREVVRQVQSGATPEQIIQWFVAQPEYGEKVLMSPPARGFNIAGYVVPGLSVAAVGLALTAWLVRRRPPPVAPVPGGAGGVAAAPDAEQLQRLRRALDDVDA